MKRYCFILVPLFALIGLMLLPLAVVHASPSPADSVHFCAPFDYEQWRRDHPRPASKRLVDLDVGEPRTVRMIYFLPNDRPYRAEAVDTMKTRMRQMQDFFAEQMKANRQGSTSIRFEADAQGEPLVLRVNGQHPTEYYNTDRTVDKVLDEIDPLFDMEENVYYIAIDNGNYSIYSGDVAVGGTGDRWGKNGGWGMVPISAAFGTVAHELGHAFGLSHDFRDDTYVMSYGFTPDWLIANQRLSACNAEFLAVHPYFNANIPIEEGSWPTLEKRTSSPIQTAGATSIPVRIKVRDPDELHQAILFAITQAPHFAEGFFEVKACRGLEGRRNPVVEFDYDGTVPSLLESDFNTFETQELVIGVVDALGDDGYSEFFELVNNEFKKPISTLSNDWPRFLSPVVFSSDGRLLALESSYEDDKVKLRNVTTGKAIATLPSWGPVWDWALSPDDRLLALEGPNRTIVLWDISSRKQHVATAPAHQQYEDFPDDPVVSSLAFSPDGRLLASGGQSDYLVKLWDVASGKHVAEFSTGDFSGTITYLTFSPDGKLLAAYHAGRVKLWDVASRKRVAEIDAHESSLHGIVNEVAFSPDGKLLATGGTKWTSGEANAEVKLWDIASREPVAILFGGAPVSFSPDGRLLASASPTKTRLVDIDGLEGGTQQGENYGGQAIKLWDVATSKAVATLPPLSSVEGVVFSPDGRLLAEQSSAAVRQWDISEWIGEGTITAVEQAMPHTLTIVSGDEQEGTVGKLLAKPFVVSVLDQNGAAFAGAVVTFSVTAGGGTLSPTTATTDANGQARSTLTLGSDPGTNTVTATVEGLEPATFTAIGQATTDSDGEEDEGESASDSPEDPEPDSQLASLSVTIDDVTSAAERDRMTFTVRLKPAPTAPTTVKYATVSQTAKAGQDYDAATGTLRFEANQNTATFTVRIRPDEQAEPNETFGVRITHPSTGALLAEATGTITDDDGEASEPQARLTPDPAEVQFSADDPAWTTFTVHTTLDSVLVRANPPGSDPALEIAGGQQVPTRDFCPAEGNDRPTRARRDGWSLHVKACQAGQTKILLIDYATGAVVQQYEINVEGTGIAATTALNPSYPNPFNSETTLSYTLPTASDIRLEVFTLSGQRVAVLHEGFQAAGYHTIALDASDLASGVYLYRLTTPEGRFAQKFTLLR